MNKLVLALVPLLAAPLLALGPQKRVQQKTAADFPTLLENANKSWQAGDYGQCTSHLRDALMLCTAKRAEAILAALPPAPEGYEVEVDRSMQDAANNPMLGAMAAAVGNVVQQDYNGPEHIQVTVTADSPLVGMFSMWVANPAMLDQDSELIEYGAHKAVLKKTDDGRSRELLILINGEHTCQIDYQGSREDFLFDLFDQAVVDRLAKVLGR